MEREEILIRTAFACMASDGYINEQEINLVKSYLTADGLFDGNELDQELEKLVIEFNQDSRRFILDYFKMLKSEHLTTDDQVSIAEFAIGIIRADEVIDYREVQFFKHIRSCLSLSDCELINRVEDIEEYLERDISDKLDLGFDDDQFFSTFNSKQVSIIRTSKSTNENL